MSSLMIVLWIFGVLVGGMALVSYHLARRYEARTSTRWLSTPQGRSRRDAVTHLVLSAWRVELQTKRH